MLRHLAAVGLLLTIPAVNAYAQPPLASDTWLVSPFLGLAFDSDADVTPTIGGELAFAVTDSIAVAGELGHLFDLASDDPAVDSSLTTVHASLLYFFDAGFVASPYVAAGVGIGRLAHEVEAPPLSISRTETGFSLGGGVTYPIAGNAWVRGDFRYFKHIDDVPSVWRLSGAITLRFPE